MSLESKNYVATAADIAALAKAYSAALEASGNVRGHYLRALVATTQAELGAKPRQRTSADETPTLDAEAVKTQLAALEAVHEKFYAVVLDNVEGNAEERNRRSGFARSAVSTVRAYVRSGRDITLLAASRVTKAALAQAVPTKRARVVSVTVLRRRADKTLAVLYKIGEQLSKADKALAVGVLEEALSKLGGMLSRLGVGRPVTDARRAIRERVPLKTKAGTFYPADRAAH
jgi:hypothetical protein